MNNIEWKENAVCYAGGMQFSAPKARQYPVIGGAGSAGESYFSRSDFKLNEIRTGDYIEASELDTEQKYNEVVDVFGLFGLKSAAPHSCTYQGWKGFLYESSALVGCYANDKDIKRKLTYAQIIAIGKLKRLIDSDESSDPFKKPEKTEQLDFSNIKFSSNKYEREITDRQGNSANIDVYDVLKAFNVTCPATQHAVKKLLCSGLRGHKNLQTDLLEAKESIVRAIELSE